MGCCMNNRQYTRFTNSNDFIDLLKKEKDHIKFLLNQSSSFKNEVDNLNHKKNLTDLYTSLNYIDKILTSEKEAILSRQYLNGVIDILDDYYDLKKSKLNDGEVNQFVKKVNEFVEAIKASEE